MTHEHRETLWTPARLRTLAEGMEAAYPEEGCGLIFEKADGSFEAKVCENLANKYHKLDPEAYPRTARDFYIVDPMEFVRAERRGARVAVVVHSHVEVGDYFSEEDVAGATMPRLSPDAPLEPSHPGTDYLVISVRQGVADHATLFRFEVNAQQFVPISEFELTSHTLER